MDPNILAADIAKGNAGPGGGFFNSQTGTFDSVPGAPKLASNLTAGDIKSVGELNAFLATNPTDPNATINLGYAAVPDQKTLSIYQTQNPGGKVVTASNGQQYYQINPAGGFHDAMLGGSNGSVLSGLLNSPVAWIGGGLAGAGALGLLGEGAAAGGALAGNALPESYWSTLADAGGASDALTAGAGTVGGNTTMGLPDLLNFDFSNPSYFSDSLSNLGGSASDLGSLGTTTDFLGNPLPGFTTNLANSGGAYTADPSSLFDLFKSIPNLLPKGLGGSAGAAGSSILSKLFGSGQLSSDDWSKLLGTLGSTALGAYGANQQTNALKDIFNQQRADRAPALGAFNNALTNPDTWYQSAPAMGAADAASRALSTQGNPADNPTLISKLAANNLGGYNSYLNTLSGPAFGGTNAQAALGTSLAQSAGGIPNALGSGLANLTNPVQNTSLSDLYKLINTGKSL